MKYYLVFCVPKKNNFCILHQKWNIIKYFVFLRKTFSAYYIKIEILLSILCSQKKKKTSGYNRKSETLLSIFCYEPNIFWGYNIKSEILLSILCY